MQLLKLNTSVKIIVVVVFIIQFIEGDIIPLEIILPGSESPFFDTA